MNKIKQRLDQISKIIVDTIPAEAIYLFGSYANGTHNKDSDIDLYVVFNDNYFSLETARKNGDII